MAKAKMTKVALAKKLGVSRSSLYYQSKKRASDEELKQKIIAVMAEHQAYGHRRVAIALTKNKKPIIRVMRKFGLKPKVRRGWRPTKSEDQNRPETRVENVLKVLCPLRANVVWAGDFTYFWFIDRFWYLATVIDIYTREIVGWHIANHHTTALIMDAFNDAARRTKTSPRDIFTPTRAVSMYLARMNRSSRSAGPFRATVASRAHGRMATRNRFTRNSSWNWVTQIVSITLAN